MTSISSLPAHWESTRLSNSEWFEIENGIWKGEKEPLIECYVVRNTNFANDGSLDLSDVAIIPIEQRYLAAETPRSRRYCH